MSRSAAPWSASRRRSQTYWRAVSGAFALLLLVGCASQPPAAAPAKPAADAKPAAAGATTAPAADAKPAAAGAAAKPATGFAPPPATPVPGQARPAADQLADKQELTVGISRNLINGEHDWLDVHASLQIWEPLIRYDEDLKLQPGLAEKWTLSPDGLTWTFNLKKGVKFSDGSEFIADDAVAVINRYKGVSGWPSIFLGGIIFPEIYGDPTAIEKIDDYSFKIVYATPRPLLPYSMSNHYSAMYSRNSWQENLDFKPAGPIGSGRFKLVDWKRDQYAIIERNEKYSGSDPAIVTKITLKHYLNANSRLAALKSGEIDALVELGAVLPVQARELSTDPNFTVAQHASSCTTYMGFNATKAPFNDIKLRQALNYAIDRQQFVKDLLYGYTLPAKGIMIQPNTPWFNTDPASHVVFDMGKAKALAKEGLNGGRAKAVLAFTPPSEGIGNWPYPQMGAFLQASLRPLGFDIELKQLETAALNDVRKTGDFDLVLANNCWSSGDPNYIMRRLMHSKSVIQAPGSQNGGYNNPEVDKLLDDAMVEIDPVKQKAMYDKLQLIAAQELPLLPMYDQVTITAAQAKVKGLSQRIAYAPTFDTVYLTK
jgi:peptide/nickel transport system substrate-binding protein